MSIDLTAALPYNALRPILPMPIDINHPLDPQDAPLVKRAQAGDEQAFEQLVHNYRNQVYALSFHFLRNREAAWDAAQETFIKAHRALRRFRSDATFKTWLLKITANHCKDQIKKNRLKTIPLDYTTQNQLKTNEPGPAQLLEARELGQAIQEAIDTLPIKHRTAFLLREYEGLSYQEMAQVMNCSTGTVMSRLHHARRKLQNILRDNGIMED